jgi:hypothetical protein
MALLTVLLVVGAIVVVCWLGVREIRAMRVPQSVAFFHPNCGANGGGELVMWQAIVALIQQQQQQPDGDTAAAPIVIYSSAGASATASIIASAARDFGLDAAMLVGRVRLVRVRSAYLIFRPFPVATLLL